MKPDTGNHGMKVCEALEAYLVKEGVRSAEMPSGQLYDDRWIRYSVGGKRIPIFPLGPFENSIAIHDAHHMLTGYDTDIQGEVAIAAWELASGGCGRHWFMWLDRISVVLISLFLPKVFLEAWKKGWRAKNLYRLSPRKALGMDLEASRRWIAGASD